MKEGKNEVIKTMNEIKRVRKNQIKKIEINTEKTSGRKTTINNEINKSKHNERTKEQNKFKKIKKEIKRERA